MLKSLFAGFVAVVLFGACAQPFAPVLLDDNSPLGTESESRGIVAPVLLQSAKSRMVNLGSALLVGVIDGSVEVANYSSSKSVLLHYSLDGQDWKSIPVHYSSTLANGREVWSFSLEVFEESYTYSPVSRNLKFALEMKANGSSWWDNNDGMDYCISTRGTQALYPLVALGGQVFAVQKAHYGSVYPAGTVLTIDLALRNLSYAKDVQVVFTTDSWATYKTAPAYYQDTYDNGLEYWLAAPVISVYNRASSNNTYAETVEFAVFYNVNGVSFWDNNNGRNYVLNAGEVTE